MLVHARTHESAHAHERTHARIHAPTLRRAKVASSEETRFYVTEAVTSEKVRGIRQTWMGRVGGVLRGGVRCWAVQTVIWRKGAQVLGEGWGASVTCKEVVRGE